MVEKTSQLGNSCLCLFMCCFVCVSFSAKFELFSVYFFLSYYNPNTTTVSLRFCSLYLFYITIHHIFIILTYFALI